MMRLTRYIVAALLFSASPLACTGQVVYSINDIVLRSDEREWLVRSDAGWYGLLQFSDRNSEGAPWIRQTSVYFGGHLLTVRLPATAVAGIGALAVPSLVLLSMAGLGRLRRVKTPDEAEH